MSDPATATAAPPVSSAVVERSIDLVLAVGVLLAMLVEAGVRATSRPAPTRCVSMTMVTNSTSPRREPWHAACNAVVGHRGRGPVHRVLHCDPTSLSPAVGRGYRCDCNAGSPLPPGCPAR